MTDLQRPLVLDQVIALLEDRGWEYHPCHLPGRAPIPQFLIGELPDHKHVQLFRLSLNEDENEWILKRGLSAWNLTSFPNPLTLEEITNLMVICSRHA